MKRALEWIKSNPFNVTAAAIAIVGLVALVYIYFMLAPNSAAAKSTELQQVKQTQDMLLAAQVLLPNKDPNGPPDVRNVVINQEVITTVRGIYDTIRDQQREIFAQTQTENSANHIDWLLGGRAIWNTTGGQRPASLLTQAAGDYLTHHKVLFQHDAQSRWNMPYLAAGGPPTPQEINDLLASSATRFLGRIGQTTSAELDQQQAEQLFSEQREKLMELLTGRARDINLYVTLPPEDDRFAPAPSDANQPGTSSTPSSPQGIENPFGGGAQQATAAAINGYPFPIAPWARATTNPQIDELWEGQVQLWILRDVMWAIYNTCDLPSYDEVYYTAANPAPSGPQFGRSARDREGLVRVDYDENQRPRNPSPYCVINSPIKRLLVLETLPGYVGLHNSGAALLATDRGPASRTSESQFILATNSMSTRGNSDLGVVRPGTQAPQSIYPTPAASLAPQAEGIDIRDHFGITPTGRVSNSVFDVRHSRLVIDIEWNQLPRFMAELREVNFMTVLRVHIEDVDEYEMLQQGYVYGSGDVVRVEMIIESLWFRDWTKNFMPEIVKDQLLMNGVAEQPTDAVQY